MNTQQFWQQREADLLARAGDGFMIDEGSMGCDHCGARIPHDGQGVADFHIVGDDLIVCFMDKGLYL